MTYSLRLPAVLLLLLGTASAALPGCSLQGFDQYATAGAGGTQGGDTTKLPNNTAGTHAFTDNTPDAGIGGTAGAAGASGAAGSQEPEYSDAGVGQNIVPDPGFETAVLTGWGCWGGCEIALNDEIQCFDGSQCLKSTARGTDWSGPSLDITNLVQPGRPYEVSVQVASGEAAPAQLTLKQLCAGATSSTFEGLHQASTLSDHAWTEFRGSFFAPSCDLTSLYLYVEGPASGIDLFVDELYITLLE